MRNAAMQAIMDDPPQIEPLDQVMNPELQPPNVPIPVDQPSSSHNHTTPTFTQTEQTFLDNYRKTFNINIHPSERKLK